MSLVAKIVKLLGDEIDCLALEWGGISFIAIYASYLAQNTLNQMTNSHTGWNGMRIHNHVRHHTFHCEWQVFLSISDTTGSLLSVPGGELVTNLGDLDGSHFDFNKSIHFFICSQNDLVNDSFLRMLQGNTPIFVGLCVLCLGAELLIEVPRHFSKRNLTNDYVITTYLSTWGDYPVQVELVVASMFPSRAICMLGLGKGLI